jgi:hypothetical protein
VRRTPSPEARGFDLPILLANEALTPPAPQTETHGYGHVVGDEPGRQAIEIERGGTRHLRHVGFRRVDLATAPESTRAYTL